MQPPRSSTRGSGAIELFHRDARGGVMVEFAVALMPLMITFSSFVQLAQITTARLVAKHATIVGARAAAVIANGHANTPDQAEGANGGEVETGVQLALGPWLGTMKRLNVTVDDASSCEDPFGAVTVTLDADYACSVPLGGLLVCLGGTHRIHQAYAFPHQGARYSDISGKCSPASPPKWIPDPFPSVNP